jgi:hypothetical protein
MRQAKVYLLYFIFMMIAIQGAAQNAATPPQNFIEKLLRQAHLPALDTVLNAPKLYEVQVIYTEITRNRHNRPSFVQHDYRLAPNQYFYPASTIKLPAAVFALQFLNEQGISPYQSMKIKALNSPEYELTHDSTAANGQASVAHYIHKNFVVSDNDAYTRLFELVGQAYLHENLQKYGYKNTRILRRLRGVQGNENQFANAFDFYDAAGSKTHSVQQRYNANVYKNDAMTGCPKGVGYYKNDSLIQTAMDFSEHNCFPLEEQHRLLQQIIFSETNAQKLQLTTADYVLLYKSMCALPRQSLHPRYADTTEYYDGYCKFFMYGNGRATIPDHIKIYNKVGWAYGTLTDNAYIIDTKRGIEFLLTATIYVNADQVFNDDSYEYETIGLPFLHDLGNVIYDYECTKKRKYAPKFSSTLLGK